MTICDAKYFPIVREYQEKMAVPEIVDKALNCKMDHSPGRVVMGMVSNILSCRSPLYRVQDFFEGKDIATIVGANIPSTAFCDDNLGRILDRIFDYGSQKLFSEISIASLRAFCVPTKNVHVDTTSVSVWGCYKRSKSQKGPTACFGHSKDNQPDLKQFMISLVSVDKNIPMIGQVEDGNASDKTIHTQCLQKVSNYMSSHSLSADYIYVGDCALVSPDNLDILGGLKTENKQAFVSRLPETYSECARVRKEAIAANQWQEIGKLSEDAADRPAATYKSYESTVTIDDKLFRTVVLYSNVLDQLKQKTINRRIQKEHESLEKKIKKVQKKTFHCSADAFEYAKDISGQFYTIQWNVAEKPIFQRGRVKMDQPRKISRIEYSLNGILSENPSVIDVAREEAGCFVLITNIATEKKSAKELLQIYKEQHGIEQNFGFLKDPLIVNDLFLKTPGRIEALGCILLVALLVWRLMERQMRQQVQMLNTTVTGWNNRPTKRPTSFMMTTKFTSVYLTVDHNGDSQLAQPLNDVQQEFLRLLGISQSAFLRAKCA